MSTNSTIGVLLPSGEVKSVYCHWDGYPSGVGKDLKAKNFQSIDEVSEFINEGGRSCVDLSYKEMRDEDCPPATNASKEEYFAEKLRQYMYLFEYDSHQEDLVLTCLDVHNNTTSTI